MQINFYIQSGFYSDGLIRLNGYPIVCMNPMKLPFYLKNNAIDCIGLIPQTGLQLTNLKFDICIY